MRISRRHLGRLAAGLMGAAMLWPALAAAQDKPAPFDNPGDVEIALVRYLSTGDFFQAYLSGVEAQAKALGVNLRVLDSRQDAALQSDMVDQAIAGLDRTLHETAGSVAAYPVPIGGRLQRRRRSWPPGLENSLVLRKFSRARFWRENLLINFNKFSRCRQRGLKITDFPITSCEKTQGFIRVWGRFCSFLVK